MKYESQKTVKGNIGVSFNSQEDAEKQAGLMDKNNCKYCINCTNCINCIDCIDCTGVFVWTATEKQEIKLLAVNGLYWPVTISSTHMQIGCQQHTHKFWLFADEETIDKMHSNALKFWKTYKTILMQLCEFKVKEFN